MSKSTLLVVSSEPIDDFSEVSVQSYAFHCEIRDSLNNKEWDTAEKLVRNRMIRDNILMAWIATRKIHAVEEKKIEAENVARIEVQNKAEEDAEITSKKQAV